MKTKIITLYEFKELSDEAKKKALSSLSDINVDYNWHEYTYEDAENIGLKITSFDIERKLITGYFVHSALICVQNILKEHGEGCQTYKTAHGYLDGLLSDELNNQTEEEFLNDILFDYLNMLKEDYEYRTSEVQVIETIECNEYYFTENGKIEAI